MSLSDAELPVLSAREQTRWNRLGNLMSQYHASFKHEFNTIYELADGSFSKQGLSLPDYLRVAHGLKTHLTAHHTIEERFVFPILAKRMPQFKGHHLESHSGIHDGLDRLDDLLSKYRSDPSLYSPKDMKACLDSWREVLFRHLDEEVEDLQGDNLRKHSFTIQEIEQITG